MASSNRNWIQEERRRTLGDWVAFCPSCGHVARYFEEHEDERGFAKYMDCGTVLFKSKTGHHEKVLKHYRDLGVEHEEWDVTTLKEKIPAYEVVKDSVTVMRAVSSVRSYSAGPGGTATITSVTPGSTSRSSRLPTRSAAQR